MSVKEVRDYLSGDMITCLRCGRSLRNLGVHLRRIHAIEPDEYREWYGLPLSRGISCQDSAHAKAMCLKRSDTLEALTAARMLPRRKPRLSMFKINVAIANLPNRKADHG